MSHIVFNGPQGETKGQTTGGLPDHMIKVSIDNLVPDKEYYIKLDDRTLDQVDKALHLQGNISGVAIGTFVRKWNSFKEASTGMGLNPEALELLDCMSKQDLYGVRYLRQGSLIGFADRKIGNEELHDYLYSSRTRTQLWAQFTNLRKVGSNEEKLSAPIMEAKFMGENSRQGDIIAPLFSRGQYGDGFTFYEVTKDEIIRTARRRKEKKEANRIGREELRHPGLGRIIRGFLGGRKKRKTRKHKKKHRRKTTHRRKHRVKRRRRTRRR